MSESASLPEPALEEVFRIEVEVEKPMVVGRDGAHGRRQLIALKSGRVSGKVKGQVMPCGVDSQIIDPSGFTRLEARYGVMDEEGESFYIENAGIRRVDPSVAARAAAGEIVDPKYVYFATVPRFEAYSEKYRWLEESIFISYAVRLPDKVLLRFYRVL